MKLELSQDYPTSLDQLLATFSNPEYPERKYKSLGATSVKLLKFESSPKLIEVDLERTTPIPADKVPDWARKFIGGEQTLRHQTKWDRSSPTTVDAVLNVIPANLPVKIEGTGKIVQLSAQQTRLTLQFEIRCKVPLIGGKVETLFVEQVRNSLADDHAFTLKYLQQPG